MKKIIISLILGALFTAAFPIQAFAEDESEGDSMWILPNYRINLRERATLMGDWGGYRTYLGEKGIILAINNNTTFQAVLDGGKREEEVVGGSIDYELQLDFQKMGLWPGAFVRVYAETQYGNFINSSTGAGIPANLDGTLPLVDEDITTLTGLVFYQFLSEWFALTFGKLDTLGGDPNEFAAGRGNDQFINASLVFNPVLFRTTPVAALGGGFFIILPGEDSTFGFIVLDPDGTADDANFDHAFESGVLFSSELRLKVNPFGLKGHQLLGGSYSTKDITILDQDLRLLLLQLIFTGSATVEKSSDSWAFYYNFNQYLYQEQADS